ncbi:MAG TPA: D-aminoacyl-tRNA deacylase [Opitutaceae bacterium]|jgi:D-tyrosyl-tRNA(Tyr) deacylase|nr:D-aminoacyl-tRNA deacylase [Opitutaceae bacterium]HOR23724.1 D-aminoacyl-tRNA deacylase [Opitutaceae bacterium]HPK48583.1 D-aminoacyl-tRNA deacylase [Opitutaceae bacterium]
MRAVVQRVSSASVSIEGAVVGSIGPGLLVLLGVAEGDTPADGAWLAQKIAQLRIFSDEADRMNRSVQDIAGGVLVVSQFTLFASTRKGTRPSFNAAAAPELANSLYEGFVRQLESILGRPVPTGRFAAMMQVALVNDGPVTLLIDTKTRE